MQRGASCEETSGGLFIPGLPLPTRAKLEHSNEEEILAASLTEIPNEKFIKAAAQPRSATEPLDVLRR